jgi:hypothetical protein
MMAKRVYSDFERNQMSPGVTRMYNTECGTLTRLIEESGTIYGINYGLQSGRATPTVSVPSFPFSLLPLNLLYLTPPTTNSALRHPPLSLNLPPSAPTPFYLFSSLPKFIQSKWQPKVCYIDPT